MTKKLTLRTLAAGVTALALTAALIPAHAVKPTYLDVDANVWYANPIVFCHQHELMDGLTSDMFAPTELMTRATLAEALYRLEGRPAVEAGEELPFSDVTAEHPNLSAILWARETGVVSGYPDGRFGPEDPITREQIAVLLWNHQNQTPPAAAVPYDDRANISGWALSAVEWAYGVKMMSGTTDNRFLPLNNTSRAEGAVIVMHYAQSYYGLRSGYDLPAPKPIAGNPYDSASFVLDANGYLSYQGMFPSYRGLDVSAHQKEIDWTQVAAAGMDFAMIRAGYRGYTRGSLNKDAYFEANMNGALANGLQVGVYFYSQALTPKEAEEEAYLLLDWIKGYPITYPVVFDWEEVDRDNSRSQGADGNTVTACALAFCKVIEEAGYIPMTYGSPSKVNSGGILLEHLQDYPFWLAHYTRNTAPTSFRYNYHIWQYTSSGRVNGIEGNVDLNLCLTNWYTWSKGGNDPWNFGPI